MKRFLTILLACSMLFALSACKSTPARVSAEATVDQTLKALQTGDQGAEDIIFGDNGGEEDPSTTMIQTIMQKMTYTIQSAEEDEEAGTAAVTAEIHNVDMAEVMAEATNAVVDEVVSAMSEGGEAPSDEEIETRLYEIVNEMLSGEVDATAYSATVTIALELSEDDEWMIVPDDELVDALTGGISGYIGD